ncbi:MAG: peptidylprolyl isomerase [Marinifilaceae bacterium]|nr:peptidylprolyl isomerase [Marinifilaceae bacterium]
MKKNILIYTLFLVGFFFNIPAICQEKEQRVIVETSLGNMTFKLYNDTPQHRDNFIRLAREGQYDGTLFYRVVKNFMIQGGSSDSRNARPGQALGYGQEINIPAEIRNNHYHKKGALAAPRQPDNMNPKKESDISQFYIVHGKKYTGEEIDEYVKSINAPIKRAIQEKYYYPKKSILDSLRAQKNVPEFRKIAGQVKAQINAEWAKNTQKIDMPENKRQDYINLGGCPHLDKEYTIFGEMIDGFEVLDRIASLPTDKRSRPLNDVKIIHVKIVE